MGPPASQPPLPEYEFATVPASHSFVSKRLQESNWLQAMEGGIEVRSEPGSGSRFALVLPLRVPVTA